jgi:hypothetical protein
VRKKLPIIAYAILGMAFAAQAQEWTHSENMACYNAPTLTKCYARDALEQFIFAFDPNASTQAPIAKSSPEVEKLVFVLRDQWTVEHPPVKPKSDGLHDQLAAYFDGNAALLEELRVMYAQDKDNLSWLLQNDAANKQKWQLAVARWKFRKEAVDGYANRIMRLKTSALAETQPDAQKVYLDGDSGIRPAYEEDRGVAAREYAANQVLQAVKESVNRQQSAKTNPPANAPDSHALSIKRRAIRCLGRQLTSKSWRDAELRVATLIQARAAKAPTGCTAPA